MLYLNEHRFIQKTTYEDYRNGYLFSQPSPTRDLFLRAFNDEAVHVQQLYELLTKETIMVESHLLLILKKLLPKTITTVQHYGLVTTFK